LSQQGPQTRRRSKPSRIITHTWPAPSLSTWRRLPKPQPRAICPVPLLRPSMVPWCEAGLIPHALTEGQAVYQGPTGSAPAYWWTPWRPSTITLLRWSSVRSTVPLSQLEPADLG